jgi:hypothetical protein
MNLFARTWPVFAAAAALAGGATAAHADDMPAPLGSPAMSATLSDNANPIAVTTPFGKIYISGQLTALALSSDNAVPPDKRNRYDISNAQLEVQKTDGMVQFYVQGGSYSLPSLGTPYFSSSDIPKDTYSYVPLAYVKLQPTAEWSFQFGKLPTLVGAEYTFTFQNINIARGLLWNQEPAVSNGVQVNYAKGPWTVSASWNDGYYSKHWNTGSVLISDAVTKADTVAFDASIAFSKVGVSTFATPIAQNNGQVYNLMWTHTEGPWVFNPYLQYTRTPAEKKYGLPTSASTFGAAALVKYSVTPTFSLGGRAEYTSSSGSGVSLLYGPSSKAWSLTFTPTWQVKTFFIRGELSYVGLEDIAPGAGFGKSGNEDKQTRVMLETGVLF